MGEDLEYGLYDGLISAIEESPAGNPLRAEAFSCLVELRRDQLIAGGVIEDNSGLEWDDALRWIEQGLRGEQPIQQDETWSYLVGRKIHYNYLHGKQGLMKSIRASFNPREFENVEGMRFVG